MPAIVIVLLAKVAVTPAGKLVGVPIPVAPVVVCVILVIAELMHKVCELVPIAEERKMVLGGQVKLTAAVFVPAAPINV